MSQIPQNNEDFDYSPEYAKLYQANDSLQSDVDDADDWTQRASEQPSEVQGAQDGEKAANLSLLFGFLAPLPFFLGLWWFTYGPGDNGLLIVIGAPLPNVLGLWQAFVARRRGTRAIGGLILNGLGLCLFIGIDVFFILILNALSGIN